MDGDEWTPAERAELERVDSLLDDPALWTEPPPGLQERVVAAIAEESARGGGRRRLRYAAAAVAASLVLAVGTTVVLSGNHDHPVTFAASVVGTPLAPGSAGDVMLTKSRSGWRIQLHLDGLPRRADGRFYEAWLKNDDGLLVSVGTFNDGKDVTLWSGVTPADFGTLTITREVLDGNPASSGEVVARALPKRS